jgi:hypothetical protein
METIQKLFANIITISEINPVEVGILPIGSRMVLFPSNSGVEYGFFANQSIILYSIFNFLM